MATLASKKRKLIIRASIPLLVLAVWGLGDVKRSYLIQDSSDGRFSTSLVENRGWNSFDLHSHYFVYVTDNQTGENVLATKNVVYCGFEKIALNSITWDKDNRSFTCLWTIQGNGVYKQPLKIESEPLRVQVGPSCCSGG